MGFQEDKQIFPLKSYKKNYQYLQMIPKLCRKWSPYLFLSCVLPNLDNSRFLINYHRIIHSMLKYELLITHPRTVPETFLFFP